MYQNDSGGMLVHTPPWPRLPPVQGCRGHLLSPTLWLDAGFSKKREVRAVGAPVLRPRWRELGAVSVITSQVGFNASSARLLWFPHWLASNLGFRPLGCDASPIWLICLATAGSKQQLVLSASAVDFASWLSQSSVNLLLMISGCTAIARGCTAVARS